MPEQDAVTGVPGSLTDGWLNWAERFHLGRDIGLSLTDQRLLVAEIRRLRAQVAGHFDRIAAQSELLSKRAEVGSAGREAMSPEEQAVKLLSVDHDPGYLTACGCPGAAEIAAAIREAVAEGRERCRRAVANLAIEQGRAEWAFEYDKAIRLAEKAIAALK